MQVKSTVVAVQMMDKHAVNIKGENGIVKGVVARWMENLVQCMVNALNTVLTEPEGKRKIIFGNIKRL